MEERSTILIVDDEPFNIDYLEQELEDMGYHTVSAANGQEAMRSIAAQEPDMVLLDIMMPVMDGFQVLAELKGADGWRDIPVVVISATSDLESVAKGIQMGAEDYLPKPFDPVILKARIHAGLEKKRLRDVEKAYLKTLERELEIAREIQAEFLPEEFFPVEGWDIAAFFQPARQVAGDFYDLFELPGGRIAVMLGDVCDKGVGAALYMTLFRSLLRAMTAFDACEDGELLTTDEDARLVRAVAFVNNYICQVHHSASYATLFIAILEPQTGGLLYLNAGQDPPLLLDRGEILSRLNPTGPMIGVLEDMVFQVSKTTLKRGQTLLIYTDGLTDVQNQEGERFGKRRFLEFAQQPHESSRALLDHLRSGVCAFMGDEAQYDDITLMAIRRKS
jgi:serine phosphatase RsbU (regulator of sigma subunit)